MYFSVIAGSKHSSTFYKDSDSTYSVTWVCFESVCVFFLFNTEHFFVLIPFSYILLMLLSIPLLQEFQVVVHLMVSLVVHLTFNASFFRVLTSFECFGTFRCTSSPPDIRRNLCTTQKMKFSIRDFFIYWRNPYWKTSSFVQCQLYKFV